MTGLLLSFALSMSPDRLSAEYLHRLELARDAPAIQSLRHDFEEILSARRVCETQVRHNLVPWGCYHMVRLEAVWKVLSRSDATKLSHAADLLCQSAVLASLKTGGTLEAESFPELSDRCRGNVQRAAAIGVYRAMGNRSGKDFEAGLAE